MYTASPEKDQLGTKAKKMATPLSHDCCLIIVLQCSGKKILQSGCARKQVTINMAGPLSGHFHQKQ